MFIAYFVIKVNVHLMRNFTGCLDLSSSGDKSGPWVLGKPSCREWRDHCPVRDDSENLALLAAFGDDGADLPLRGEQGSFSGSDLGNFWTGSDPSGWQQEKLGGRGIHENRQCKRRGPPCLLGCCKRTVRADLVAKSITEVVGSLSGVSEAISSLP